MPRGTVPAASAAPRRQPPRPTGQSTVSAADAAQTEEQEEGGDDAPVDLSSMFDKAKAATGGGTGIEVEPGDYDCFIKRFEVLDPKPGKGLLAIVVYEVCDEGDVQGKNITSFYNLTMPDRKTPHQGMEFLKRDLAKLGFDEIPGGKFQACMAQLVEEKAAASVKVKQNGKYMNAYLNNGIEASDIVDAWKAERPEDPLE